MKLIRDIHFEFHQNPPKITCTSPYRGEFDCKMRIILLFLRPQKNIKLTRGGHFEFQLNLHPENNYLVFAPTKKRSTVAAILNFSKTLKISHAHLHIVGECDSKI